MAKTVNHFYETVRCIRFGNVSVSVVDSVRVEAYGQPVPIKHLAGVVAKAGQPISIHPYDINLTGEINTELQRQGFKSYIAGKGSISVSVPPMSGDERAKIQTHVKKLAEESRISIRSIRKTYRKKIDEIAESKDDAVQLEKTLQTHIDESIAEIDMILEDKLEAIGST